jgi:hypothetical protein
MAPKQNNKKSATKRTVAPKTPKSVVRTVASKKKALGTYVPALEVHNIVVPHFMLLWDIFALQLDQLNNGVFPERIVVGVVSWRELMKVIHQLVVEKKARWYALMMSEFLLNFGKALPSDLFPPANTSTKLPADLAGLLDYLKETRLSVISAIVIKTLWWEVNEHVRGVRGQSLLAIRQHNLPIITFAGRLYKAEDLNTTLFSAEILKRYRGTPRKLFHRHYDGKSTGPRSEPSGEPKTIHVYHIRGADPRYTITGLGKGKSRDNLNNPPPQVVDSDDDEEDQATALPPVINDPPTVEDMEDEDEDSTGFEAHGVSDYVLRACSEDEDSDSDSESDSDSDSESDSDSDSESDSESVIPASPTLPIGERRSPNDFIGGGKCRSPRFRLIMAMHEAMLVPNQD